MDRPSRYGHHLRRYGCSPGIHYAPRQINSNQAEEIAQEVGRQNQLVVTEALRRLRNINWLSM